MFTCQNSSKNDDFSNFDHKWSLFKVQRKNASIKMEKKLGYNIYQCQMVSSGVVSNGVEWCGVKWCRVSVMTLESLGIYLRHPDEAPLKAVQLFNKFRFKWTQISACRQSGNPFRTIFMSIPFV